jgi:hypothetical protein
VVLLTEEGGGTHLSILQKNCVKNSFRTNRERAWSPLQEDSFCGSQDRAENQGGQIVEPEAGERSLRRVEKGELLNSGVELVDANLS